MNQILCIGDIMVDVVVHADQLSKNFEFGSDTKSEISMRGGGQAANVASWLTQVFVKPFMVARVGNDEMGDFLINDLDQFGISHTAKRITNAKTGMVVVLVDKSGERTMFPDSGANSGLGVSDLPELTGFKLAFISAYALINPASRNGVLEIIKVLRSKNIKVFIDPASVGALQSIAKPEINSWLAQANFLIMNFDEAKFLTDKNEIEPAIETLLEQYKQIEFVVIKVGAEGAYAKRRGENLIFEKSIKQNAVDSTGAGDSFTAGFMAKYLDQLDSQDKPDISTAVRAGNELAAKCVAQIGARPLVANQ